MADSYDVFLSYAHADGARVRPMVEAFRKAGLKVWLDSTEIRKFESIARSISDGLANAKTLVAFFSDDYPTRRPCQWELTAAYLAAQREGDALRRLLVLNPETHVHHIDPSDLREQLFATLHDEQDAQALSELAASVRKRCEELAEPFRNVRLVNRPSWYGTKALGSSRFVGRYELFWKIHASLFESEAPPLTAKMAPGHVELRGLGGIGKSLMAEEYALRFAAAYPGGVFFLRGTDDREAQLADFAARLGLALSGLEPREIAGWLDRRLDKAGEHYLWLVDDLPAELDESERRGWFAPNHWGKTLVTTTTRRRGPAPNFFDLSALEPEDGLQLLTANRKPVGDEETAAAREIVAELGGHPLAIDVTGGALNKLWGRETFAGFLEKLRHPTADVLKAAADLSPDLPNGHEVRIAATLMRSVALLSEPAQDFLRLSSVLAPEPIAVEFIDAIFARLGEQSTWGAAAVADTVVNACMADVSLGCTGAHASYCVHRLVRHAVRLHDPDSVRQQQLRELALPTIDQALQRAIAAWDYDQLNACVCHARHLANRCATESEVGLLLSIAEYEGTRGHYSVARRDQERALEATLERFGPAHANTLRVKHNLASTLYAQGELPAARACQEAVLSGLNRQFGGEHPDVLTAKSSLALTLVAQGQLARARALQDAVLECRKLSGAEDEDALTARENLAATLLEQGDYVSANEQLKTVLGARTRLHGAEHPRTLTTRANLAEALHAMGDLITARAYQEGVLETRERLFGANHRETLLARMNLAGTLHASGLLAEARQHQALAYQGFENELGNDHHLTLQAGMNLATMLSQLGDPKALDLQLENFDSIERVLGAQSTLTLMARSNLACTLAERGDFEAAQQHHEAVLKLRSRKLGQDHPETLKTRGNLAGLLKARGAVTEAAREQRAVLAALCRKLGDEHPQSLLARNNLAGTLYDLGELEAALEHLRLVVDARQRVLGANHPATRDALFGLCALATRLASQSTDRSGAGPARRR